ncbi:c-type cytochrome [Niabella beijingensis]|uniref:c-type cytochrome n=1 Tax=Niabella beijingensis TaxID=2872700 RepID=UPI001CBC99F2|nr:c-type cytochrome [Niabella beijingensis]MBZ4188982.1 c-type cytochrome [Niabella beijingensis]
MPYKKITAVFSAVLLVICAGASFSFYTPPHNLKVLPQDITHERLDSIMESFNKALGVKCDFCHAKGKNTERLDFASDENPAKEVARNMLRMTIDINKNYFRTDSVIHPAYLNTVTCNTCHKGDAYPER